MNKEFQNRIAGLFTKDKEVAALYLFGSQAKNKEHDRSDIDLAILFNEKQSSIDSFNKLQNYFVKLSRLIKKEFDLLDMERVNLLLLFEVLRDGKLLVENHPIKNRNFKAQKLLQFFDFEFILKRCTQSMHDKAMEKQHG